MRRVIVALIALALAVAVFVLWPRSDEESPSDPEASPTTTTTTTPVTTTSGAVSTTPPHSTSTVADTRVVETVEEAEAILRDLWFGWFEGIYNQDEDRIREVVGNPQLVAAAVNQFAQMEFLREPVRQSLAIEEIEILLSTPECLAVWALVDASQIVGASNDGVHVFLNDGGSWLFISQWADRNDRWQADCQAQLSS